MLSQEQVVHVYPLLDLELGFVQVLVLLVDDGVHLIEIARCSHNSGAGHHGSNHRVLKVCVVQAHVGRVQWLECGGSWRRHTRQLR